MSCCIWSKRGWRHCLLLLSRPRAFSRSWCWAGRQASCWMAASGSTVLRYPSVCIFWVLPWPAHVQGLVGPCLEWTPSNTHAHHITPAVLARTWGPSPRIPFSPFSGATVPKLWGWNSFRVALPAASADLLAPPIHYYTARNSWILHLQPCSGLGCWV